MKNVRFSVGDLRGWITTILKKFAYIPPVMLSVVCSVSCDGFFMTATGELSVSIAQEMVFSEKDNASLSDGAKNLFPDKDDFILDIKNSGGKSIYYGRFGDSPEKFDLKPGSYTIGAKSCEFSKPEYERPQFGDTQVVVVKEHQAANVRLLCHQLNSGLRLVSDESLQESFPDGQFVLSCESGSLECEYGEPRYAFFNPGGVAASIRCGSDVKGMFSRQLAEGQMLEVRISAGEDASQGSRVSIRIDSSRVWNREDLIFGDRDASYIENAYSIAEARDFVPQKAVWVYGYIVGVATGTGKFSFEPPFLKNTNIILGPRSFTDESKYCLSVELRSKGIREELNLADNPSMKGRQLYIKGDLVESYYGIPGLKNITEYQFDK